MIYYLLFTIDMLIVKFNFEFLAVTSQNQAEKLEKSL